MITQSTREGRLSWLLFLTVLISYSYFIHFIGTESWNASSRFFLTFSLADEGTLNIDKYHTKTGDKAYANGHYYSDKAPGPALVAVPFYLVLKTFGVEQEKWIRYALTVLVIGIPGALAAVYFRKILCMMGGGDAWQTTATTLGYALGTLVFPFSTIFYGHPLAAACGVGTFYALLAIRKSHTLNEGRLAWLAGFFGSVAVLSDYPASILMLASLAYCLAAIRSKKIVLCFALGAALPLLILGLYNAHCFGSPLRTGYSYHHSFDHAAGFFGIGFPRPEALWGITFSPYRGIFYQSPFLLFLFPGAWLLFREKHLRFEFGFLVLVVLGFFLFNAGYEYWDGIGSAGARFLIPGIPFMVLLTHRAQRVWPQPFQFLVALSIGFMLVITATEPRAEYNVKNPLFYYNFYLLREGALADNLGSRMGFGGLASLIPWGAAFLALLAFIPHPAKKQAPGAGPYRQILYGIATVSIVGGWIFMAGKAEPHLAEYQKAEALYHHFRCRNNMDLDRLKQQYEKAIALAPAFEAPYYRMADIAQSMGRSSLALSYYDRLGSRAVDPAIINVHKALVYERLGDRTTAAALYREAHRLAPNDWQVMLRWADFQWRNRNVSFALQILERAHRLYPENPTIRRALETVNRHRR